MKILIVDDREENLLAMKALLSQEGLDIITAQSGNAALELLIDHDVALTLLDVQMPGMDGFETARLMRGIEKTCHIPIIFITAINKDEKFVFKGYQAGAVDYLFKPVEPDIIRGKVRVFLELHRQKIDLEREIAERKKSEEIQVKLLKDLELANAEINEFAYVASHDLKAPLRTITILLEMLHNSYTDCFDEKAKQDMGMIIEASSKMRRLIDGILEYSRAGRVTEEVQTVDLRGLIQETIVLFAPQAESVQMQIVGNFPTLTIEPVRINQVFQNLIGNALKFLDKPQGRILIECASAGDFWKLSVSDNGPGIEERFFEKIFQIFGTLKKIGPGDESTGIGLAIIKKIVERYGGKVWVESVVGEGCIFFFTLPKKSEQ